jgi:ribosomal-protein-alanine N-acetyltransferase
MTRAVRQLGLHRVEASIRPDNTHSITLVTRIGFRREGFSLRYLKLGGQWRDHERWVLLREEWLGVAALQGAPVDRATERPCTPGL